MTTHLPNQFKIENSVRNKIDNLAIMTKTPENNSSGSSSKDSLQQQIEFIVKKVFENFLESASISSDKIRMYLTFDKIQEIPGEHQFQVQASIIFNPFYILNETFLRKTKKQKEEDIAHKIRNILESYRFKYKFCSYKISNLALRRNEPSVEVFSKNNKIKPSNYYYYCKFILTLEYQK